MRCMEISGHAENLQATAPILSIAFFNFTQMFVFVIKNDVHDLEHSKFIIFLAIQPLRLFLDLAEMLPLRWRHGPTTRWTPLSEQTCGILVFLSAGVHLNGSQDGSAVVAEEDAVPLLSPAGIFFSQFCRHYYYMDTPSNIEWYVDTPVGACSLIISWLFILL